MTKHYSAGRGLPIILEMEWGKNGATPVMKCEGSMGGVLSTEMCEVLKTMSGLSKIAKTPMQS